MRLNELTNQFNQNHPELDGVAQEGIISAEHVHALRSIFDAKIVSLSRRQELADHERMFVDYSLDMGARCLTYWLERYDLPLPQSTPAIQIVNRLRASVRASGYSDDETAPIFSTNEMLADKALFIRLLGSMSGGGMAIDRLKSSTRAPVEEAARNVLAFMTVLADENPSGLPVDDYLSGNIKNMLAHYELTQQPSS